MGSFDRSCDQTTGQCKCRPGVIGRRCDLCPNSYAEVTQKGCEGNYKSRMIMDVDRTNNSLIFNLFSYL